MAKPTRVDETLYEENETYLDKWAEATAALEQTKVIEKRWREYIVATFFPENFTGTRTVELPDGRRLKCVKGMNYKLDKDQVYDPNTQPVRVSYDIREKDYRELPADEKAAFDQFVTTSPSTPNLKMEGT